MNSSEKLADYPTSVIIRVKDEGAVYHQVLSKLQSQTHQSFEIVVVDDNSKDGTDTLAYDYFNSDRIKLVGIPEGKFSHPYSCNLGAEAAEGRYLTYINGHSIPISDTWLRDGLRNFNDEKVAGVFAFVLAHRDAPFAEKTLYGLFSLLHNRRSEYRKGGMGVMGTTNAILRKDLWQQHHFNQNYTIGGEDVEWAQYWMDREYVIIQDPKFRIYHSHHLSLMGLIRQCLRWRKMGSSSVGAKPIRGKDLK